VSKFNKKHYALIFGALALSVLLYFAPKLSTQKAQPEKAEMATPVEFSFSNYIDSVKNTLNKEQLSLVKQQESAIQTNKANSLATDSLIKLWMAFKQPGISAFYFETKVNNDPTAENYFHLADRYYTASKFSHEEQHSFFISKAIENYLKVLEKEPENLNAKTSLGVCYVEGTQEPMKGIALLREVVEKDPANMQAHLNLGLFAIQSGQYDKAIERFNKILAIDQNNLEVYLYLGQTYSSMGQKDKAIESLEKYKSLSKDAFINAQVDKYISELKNN